MAIPVAEAGYSSIGQPSDCQVGDKVQTIFYVYTAKTCDSVALLSINAGIGGLELGSGNKNSQNIATPVPDIADVLSVSLEDYSYVGSKDFSGIRLVLRFENKNDEPVKVTLAEGKTATGINMFNNERKLTEPLDELSISSNGAISEEYYIPRVKLSEIQGDKLSLEMEITTNGLTKKYVSQIEVKRDQVAQIRPSEAIVSSQETITPVPSPVIPAFSFPDIESFLPTIFGFILLVFIILSFLRKFIREFEATRKVEKVKEEERIRGYMRSYGLTRKEAKNYDDKKERERKKRERERNEVMGYECPECGHVADVDFDVCPYCGTEVE